MQALPAGSIGTEPGRRAIAAQSRGEKKERRSSWLNDPIKMQEIRVRARGASAFCNARKPRMDGLPPALAQTRGLNDTHPEYIVQRAHLVRAGFLLLFNIHI